MHHQQKISMGFKIVVLTPKLSMGILLQAKFLVINYFKSRYYWRKAQWWQQIGLSGMYQARIGDINFQVFTPSLISKTYDALRSPLQWYVYTLVVCPFPAFKIISPFLIVAYPKYVWKHGVRNLNWRTPCYDHKI